MGKWFSRVNGSGCGKTRVIAESWGEDFGIGSRSALDWYSSGGESRERWRRRFALSPSYGEDPRKRASAREVFGLALSISKSALAVSGIVRACTVHVSDDGAICADILRRKEKKSVVREEGRRKKRVKEVSK